MRFCKYEIIITFIDDFLFPEFFGSILRSGFGCVFKETCCVNKNSYCSKCNIIEKCSYSYVFETNVRYKDKFFNAPHPFVFEIYESNKGCIEKNSDYSLNLILLGEGIKHFPFFIKSFEFLGESGLGRNRSKFYLKKILKNDKIIYENGNLKRGWEIPDDLEEKKFDLNNSITLNFISPTKLVYRNEVVEVPYFETIVSSLIRRILLLDKYHFIGYNIKNKEEIIELAKQIKIKSYNLFEVSKKRYSSRRKTTMTFKGFKGLVTYSGEFSPFFTILRIGEVIHIGKGTAFGFGKYKLLGDN